MSEATVAPAELQSLLAAAQALDSPHIDLSGLLGVNKPVLVAVDDLHAALWNRELPTVSIHYGDDATVTVKSEDGGVMATLEVRL